ncbi:MAG: PQQ-binding-like beta-propeller repeat protein [Planctomycetia bacterium]|nr:PQQ-binding-like beta-propeller repeat protein [Planctomycetia bacterium]
MNPCHYAFLALLAAPGVVSTAEPADVRAASGITRGLACVVGDADAAADALARDSSFLVHQLVAAQRVPARRKAAAELLGRLVVEERGAILPYPDRFIDLLVIGPNQAVPEAERQRVLAVDGVAVLADGTLWRPKPDPRLDEWTHKWHAPDGNPLSRDALSGPPTAVQWAAGPMFTDGAVGGKAPRIGGGAFVFIDTVDGALVARSAANGLPRWRADHDFSQTADLVLRDGRVLAHVRPGPANKANTDEAGPLVAFDLSSGKEVVRYDKGLFNPDTPGMATKPGIAQFLAHGDGILQAIGSELVWLDAKTGQRRWEKKLAGYWFAPIILGNRVIVVETDNPAKRARIDNTPHARAVAAFNLADGKPLWRTPDILPPHKPAIADGITRVSLSPPVGADGIVLLHAGCYQSRLPDAFVAALDATTGKELWRHTIPEKEYTNTVESSRVVLLNGVAYYLGGRGVAAWDAKTGKEKFPFRKRPRYAFNGFGECSGSRCTVNWLMANGLCYWSLDGDLVTTTWAARSACGTGVFPAYGMVFALPTGCDCITYSRGYLGLSCAPLPDHVPDARRLVKGPAYGKVEKAAAGADDWPMFLHDPQRSSAAPKNLPEKLQERWQVKAADVPSGPVAADRRLSENYLGAISAPVAVGGTVLVARPERHQVAALDPATGKERWSFTAGGLIDSPPTIHQGLALFGSHDGHVYALRLSDGDLVWRFLAAPVERKAVLHGQLSSAFPVHGSVMVLDGKLIVTAGFHSDLGGLHVWVLEPLTGAVVYKTAYQGSQASDRPALNDILAADARGTVAWLGLDAGFTPGGELVKGGKKPEIPADRRPVVSFDRNGAFVRFPHDFRGGSTHGWKGGMVSDVIQAHRVCVADGMTFALADPRESDRHPVRADMVPVVKAFKDDPKNPAWVASCKALGMKESYGALLRAGDRLYLGGGKRDGSAGFVQVLDANSGKLLAEYVLPARVAECGLAAAGGRLFVSCEDGTVVCLGG